MNLDQAEKLAMNGDYAINAIEDDNPINSADAAAFFIEGYEYSRKEFKENINKLQAFPSESIKQVGDIKECLVNPGMTLLDYFAAKAMNGLLSGKWNGRENEEWSKSAYDLAEAMIKEKSRRMDLNNVDD